MYLTNFHKSLLLFFALCSFTSFVFLFQFNTTNGVLAENEDIDGNAYKFGLHYIEGRENSEPRLMSYDNLCEFPEAPEQKNACSSREKLENFTIAATYVTLIFCISLFSGFFFVLEKDELSLTSKFIGVVIICLYLVDVALHGVMFSENDSFYSALKEGFADQGNIGSLNRGQSMLYIGGSLICHLAIAGAIFFIFLYHFFYLIYSYCTKNNGYVLA